MTCPKCCSALIKAEHQTQEGAWHGLSCILCGFVLDRMMFRHRKQRPKPSRQIPIKPNRGRGIRRCTRTR